ncbi:MAG: hypothetical protein LBH07_08040 [Treponema sp.]|nr:hypothetical protein [Treponema sp.]
MFNFKISGIAAGAAFIFSLLIGLVSGIGFFMLLVRALVFAVVFFALSGLVFWLVSQYIPELLTRSEDDLGIFTSGSRVDINVEDTPIIGAFPRDNSEIVDDIDGRPSHSAKVKSMPLDQDEVADYTEGEDSAGKTQNSPATAFISNVEPEVLGRSDEVLPDMEGISENFSENENENSRDEINSGTTFIDKPRQPAYSSEKPDMLGNFDPKELAQGVQTLIKRDDKG